MRITLEDIKPLLRISRSKLAIWIILGLRDSAQDATRNRAFDPHLLIGLFETPADGLFAVYSQMPPEKQGVFRGALAEAIYRALPNQSDLGGVSQSVRVYVIDSLLSLIRKCLAWKAVPTVEVLGTQFPGYWGSQEMADDVYGRSLYTMATVAASPGLTEQLTDKQRASFHAALARLIASGRFRSNFAPTVLRALIAVHPSDLVNHLELLGEYFNDLHNEQPETINDAHLTANLIAERAPNELQKQFDRLSFSTVTDRDTWLIDALISPEGPFRLIRTENVFSPVLVTKGKPHRTYCVRHDHWQYYQAKQQNAPVVEAMSAAAPMHAATYGRYKKAGKGPRLFLMGADTLLGEDVYNDKVEKLGDIKQLMLEMDSGTVAYVVLSVVGFLDLGEKLFAVPWTALRLDTANKRFVLNIEKNRLKNAPEFDKNDWPDMTDERWANRIHSFYGTARGASDTSIY